MGYAGFNMARKDIIHTISDLRDIEVRILGSSLSLCPGAKKAKEKT